MMEADKKLLLDLASTCGEFACIARDRLCRVLEEIERLEQTARDRLAEIERLNQNLDDSLGVERNLMNNIDRLAAENGMLSADKADNEIRISYLERDLGYVNHVVDERQRENVSLHRKIECQAAELKTLKAKPEPMTLERACEVLNEHKYGGYGTWKPRTALVEVCHPNGSVVRSLGDATKIAEMLLRKPPENTLSHPLAEGLVAAWFPLEKPTPQAPPETLAITEIHNRLAKIEAAIARVPKGELKRCVVTGRNYIIWDEPSENGS